MTSSSPVLAASIPALVHRQGRATVNFFLPARDLGSPGPVKAAMRVAPASGQPEVSCGDGSRVHVRARGQVRASACDPRVQLRDDGHLRMLGDRDLRRRCHGDVRLVEQHDSRRVRQSRGGELVARRRCVARTASTTASPASSGHGRTAAARGCTDTAPASCTSTASSSSRSLSARSTITRQRFYQNQVAYAARPTTDCQTAGSRSLAQKASADRTASTELQCSRPRATVAIISSSGSM